MCTGWVLGNWDAAQAAICSEVQLWGGFQFSKGLRYRDRRSGCVAQLRSCNVGVTVGTLIHRQKQLYCLLQATQAL